MGRMMLDPSEQALVGALRDLQVQAGWTVYGLANALGLHAETLRGLLYAKNRPGAKVLYQLLVYVDQVRSHQGPKTPGVISALGDHVQRLWKTHVPLLLDRLWGRVRNDFTSVDSLARFLRIDLNEWEKFTRGEDPSPELLRAIAAVYSDEAKRIANEDPRDARRCQDTAALAQLILRLFAG
jgi:transcriptional regulator with XRE-family HTH domain